MPLAAHGRARHRLEAGLARMGNQKGTDLGQRPCRRKIDEAARRRHVPDAHVQAGVRAGLNEQSALQNIVIMNGRVALTGDAAWCPTPLSGMGTSLAITGAGVLAGEMSRTDDFAVTFAGCDLTFTSRTDFISHWSGEMQLPGKEAAR